MPRYAPYARITANRRRRGFTFRAASSGASLGATVDLFSATGSGAGDLTNSSATFADICSATVTTAQAGDVLYISATVPCYNSTGASTTAKFTFQVNSVAVRTQIEYVGLTGGAVDNPHLRWKYTLSAGDISGGSSVVKLQYARFSGLETVGVTNSADGVPTLVILRTRP